ncbi:nitrous oxide reductase family maturation protein NosD [Thermodesulfobacteriota bacterium]
MKSFNFAVIIFVFALIPYSVLADTIYVDLTGGGDYLTIQEGIDAALSGDLVLVAPGTYVENIVFPGHAIAVRSDVDGDPATEDVSPETTIISRDLELDWSVVLFLSGDNEETVLDGFTITNGDTQFGGGIYCTSSSPTITNCTISGNTAQYGGGIYCLSSSPTITNCTISDNSVTSGGGGIYCPSSSPTITNCTISRNTAQYGGGICCFAASSSPMITNCTISGNEANDDGGGIYCSSSSSPTITNCTLSGNTAQYGGGIYCWDSSSPAITNCTISGNEANDDGGGIYCDNESSVTILNSILWGDVALDDGPEIWIGTVAHPSVLAVSYSDVEGGEDGIYWEPGCILDYDESNIDVDPLFVSGELGDFYLGHIAAGDPTDSPCIDAGTGPAEEIGGTTRTDHVDDIGTVDMGYHYLTIDCTDNDADGYAFEGGSVA